MRSLFYAIAVLFFTAAAALAATIVEPGSSIVVADTDGEIAGAATEKGTVILNEGEDGRTRLIFVAPEDIPQDLVDVTYRLDGEELTRSFRVVHGAAVFGSDEVYDASLKALFILFILAVVVESGLQLLFRWRPYLRTFNTSGANAVIAFAFSWFFVGYFELDIASRLVNAYLGLAGGFDNSVVGYILTAMIIAGGSAGVNRLFRAFGIRPIDLPEEVAGPSDDTIAWISVSVTRNKAKGPITVLYGDPGEEAVVGTITGSGGGTLRSLFLRNKGRFPQSGGYRVEATSKPKKISIKAQDETGKPLTVPDWGPYPIGPRAIIDVTREV